MLPKAPTAKGPNPLNYAICLIDTFSFNFGMAFWSLTTIVPLFMRQLHAPNSLIGALPGLVALGYSLPGLLVSRTISRLKVAKWWLFWVAVAERVPLLAVAVAIPFIGSKHPQLILGLFLGAFAIHSICLGLNQPAYWAVISKTIPERIRGRVYGWAGALGAIGGISIDPITSHFLTPSAVANLTGFSTCFLIGWVILFVGILPFALVDEPISEPVSEIDPHAGHFLKDAVVTWKTEPKFRAIVHSQIFASLVFLAQPFFILNYAYKFHVGGDTIAQFTTVSVIAGALGSLIWGYIADHFGNKLVLVLGAILGIFGPVAVAFDASSSLYDLIFAVVALSASACALAGFNIVLAYAGKPKAAPYYTTIFNTVLSPPRALAPIVGGLLADTVGFKWVFVAAAIAGAVSLVALFRVEETRVTPIDAKGIA